MQRRLLVSLAGGLLGLALAPELNTRLSLDLPVAFVGFAMAGLAIGYVGSALLDVFAGHSGVDGPHSEN